jgi:hypothetical protein
MRSSSLRHLLLRSRPSSLTLSSLRRLLRSHPGKLAARPAAWSPNCTPHDTHVTQILPRIAHPFISYLLPHTFMDRCTGGLGWRRVEEQEATRQTPVNIKPLQLSCPQLATSLLQSFRLRRSSDSDSPESLDLFSSRQRAGARGPRLWAFVGGESHGPSCGKGNNTGTGTGTRPRRRKRRRLCRR